LRVLWDWKGGPWALLCQFVLTLVLATLSFTLTAWLLPRMSVDGLLAALLAVILIGAFNAVVRSLVLALVAPFSLILTGVIVLVFQVVAFLVVAQLVPGVRVDGFLTALVGSFIYAIINTILASIVGVDQSQSFYGLLVRALVV
jgi:putative membrane protein